MPTPPRSGEEFYGVRCVVCRHVIPISNLISKLTQTMETKPRIEIGGDGHIECSCDACRNTRMYKFTSLHRYVIGSTGNAELIARATRLERRSDASTFFERLQGLGRLHKYVVPERIDALQHGLIRFTPPTRNKDITDFVPRVGDEEAFGEALFRSHRNRRIERLSAAQGFVIEEHPPGGLVELAVASYKTSNRSFAEYTRRVVDHARSHFGVLSLTEDHLHDGMWGDYAAGHTGFVISFSPINEFFFPPPDPQLRIPLREVFYGRTTRYDAEGFDVTDLMFEKDAGWKHQKEWRTIRVLEDHDDKATTKEGELIHLFRFPPDIVSGVIFGADMANKDRDELKSILDTDDRYAHVDIGEAFLKKGEVRLKNVRPARRPSKSVRICLEVPTGLKDWGTSNSG